MRTPCVGCGRLVKVGTGGRCSACRTPARKARDTAEWTRISLQARASGVCSRCHAFVGSKNLEAHHTIPASERPDLALVPDLIVPLCHSCHREV